MRACVIFNPTARGNKARALRGQLDRIAAACTLKPTTGPGAATTLAAEAVKAALDDAGLKPTDVDGMVTFTIDQNEEVDVARAVG